MDTRVWRCCEKGEGGASAFLLLLTIEHGAEHSGSTFTTIAAKTTSHSYSSLFGNSEVGHSFVSKELCWHRKISMGFFEN